MHTSVDGETAHGADIPFPLDFYFFLAILLKFLSMIQCPTLWTGRSSLFIRLLPVLLSKFGPAILLNGPKVAVFLSFSRISSPF